MQTPGWERVGGGPCGRRRRALLPLLLQSLRIMKEGTESPATPGMMLLEPVSIEIEAAGPYCLVFGNKLSMPG